MGAYNIPDGHGDPADLPDDLWDEDEDDDVEPDDDVEYETDDEWDTRVESFWYKGAY